MTAPMVRPGLKYLPIERMSGSSPRRLAIVLIERQAGCFFRGNIQAGTQMAVGTVETESGLTGVAKLHGRTFFAVLIVQVDTWRAIRSEVNRYSRTAVSVGKIHPHSAV